MNLKIVCSAFIWFLLSKIGVAQLSGIYTIPGSYPNIASAVNALNAAGVSGNVIFNIAAAHTENAPVGGIVLQYGGGVLLANQSNASQTITFQKVGAGANPIIYAFTGTQPANSAVSLDGIFKIVGVDNVTIDGIDLAEIAGNASDPSFMEMGYGLLRVSNTDGTQNCTIRNCVVTLNNSHTGAWPLLPFIGSVGIFSGPITNASTTLLTGANVSGANSNNSFLGNTLQNVSIGMVVQGINDVAPYTYYDQSNILGSTGAGNTIQNFKYYGIYTICQNTLSISTNTINNMAGGGSAPTQSFYGIYNGDTKNATSNITSNTISLTSGVITGQCVAISESANGTGTANIDFNTISLAGGGGGAAFFGILRPNPLPLLANFYVGNNNFRNINITTGATSGLIYNNGNPITNQSYHDNITSGSATPFVLVDGATALSFFGMNSTAVTLATGTVSIVNNSFTDITINNPNGFCGGILESCGTLAGNTMTVIVSNNHISNVNLTSLAASAINGIQVGKAQGLATINDNFIENISGAISVTGIQTNDGSNVNIYNNVVRSLNSANLFQGIYTSSNCFGTIRNNEVYNCTVATSTLSGPSIGIRSENLPAANVLDIHENSLYNLSVAGTGVMNLSGFSLVSTAGGTFKVYNNLISDLALTASAAGGSALSGIQCGRGVYNVYFNTVALGYGTSLTSTATDFSVFGLSYQTNTNSLDLRNNILYVNATPNGTGFVSALRRNGGTAGTPPANFAATSNYNIYYAPNTINKYLYSEGSLAASVVNAYNLTNDTDFNTNCSLYKTFMGTTREDSTATENMPFIGAGIPSVKYSLTPGSLSYAESGAETLALVSTDFNAVSRPNNLVTNRPDVGFTEFSGVKKNLDVCIVLPIELIEFNGFWNNDHSKLYWETASEINNDYFILQKSDDATTWRDIAIIDGAGNSSIMLNYSFSDYELSSEIMYYRLVQVDFDGTKMTSQIVAILHAIDGGNLTVFPNPSNGIYNIKINEPIINYEVIDNLGRIVCTGISTLVDIKTCASGIYYLKIKMKDKIVIEKIIKNSY